MVRKLLIGLVALAAIAGGAHYGYWWYVTDVMMKQTAEYMGRAPAEGVTMTYTATRAGYPTRFQVVLENLHFEKKKPAAGGTVVTSIVEMGNLTLETLEPWGKGSLMLSGQQIPVAIRTTGSKHDVALTGMIGSLESTATYEVSDGLPGASSGMLRDLQLKDSKGTSVSIAQVMSHVDVAGPGVRKVLVEASNLNVVDTSSTAQIEKAGMEGTVTLPALGSVGTVVPFDLKMYVGKTKFNDTVKGQAGTMERAEMGMKFDVRGVFSDMVMTFMLQGLNAPATMKSPAINVKLAKCSFAYSNLSTSLLISSESAPASVSVRKGLLEALVNDKLRFDIKDCVVDAEGLSATASLSLGGTSDGYPDVAASVKGDGQLFALANMMKGGMLGAVEETSGTDPTHFELSVQTVSGSLVVDGQPMMALPKLEELEGMAPMVMGMVPGMAGPAMEVAGTEAPVLSVPDPLSQISSSLPVTPTATH